MQQVTFDLSPKPKHLRRPRGLALYLSFVSTLKETEYYVLCCDSCHTKRTCSTNPSTEPNCPRCPVRGLAGRLPLGKEMYEVTTGHLTPIGKQYDDCDFVLGVMGEWMSVLKTHLPLSVYEKVTYRVLRAMTYYAKNYDLPSALWEVK